MRKGCRLCVVPTHSRLRRWGPHTAGSEGGAHTQQAQKVGPTHSRLRRWGPHTAGSEGGAHLPVLLHGDHAEPHAEAEPARAEPYAGGRTRGSTPRSTRGTQCTTPRTPWGPSADPRH